MNMEASNKVIAKIKEWEGFRGKAYKDTSGVWTIGFGHTKDVKAGMLCTERVAVVQNELHRWVHDSKGDRLSGLVARREWEAQLWAEGAEG
jgi:GH24 family phage-related lysozyme (muramidase)